MTDHDALEPTSEELDLLAKLRANPHLGEGMTDLLKRLELEQGNGANAHEVELALREQLHKLGQHSLQQWAQDTSRRVSHEACENDDSLIKHEKKSSGGIAPSE